MADKPDFVLIHPHGAITRYRGTPEGSVGCHGATGQMLPKTAVGFGPDAEILRVTFCDAYASQDAPHRPNPLADRILTGLGWDNGGRRWRGVVALSRHRWDNEPIGLNDSDIVIFEDHRLALAETGDAPTPGEPGPARPHPPNPFAAAGVFDVTAALDNTNSSGLPVALLMQAALAGTQDDQVTDHLEAFAADVQDAGAWEDVAMLGAQWWLSSGAYPMGPAHAEPYVTAARAGTPAHLYPPLLDATHRFVAAWIGSGRNAAADFLTARSVPARHRIGRAMLWLCAANGWRGDHGALMAAVGLTREDLMKGDQG